MAENINQIGIAARQALSALNSAKTAKKRHIAKDRDLIEERNDAARDLLVQVRDAIVAGQAVNGQRTWEGWAKNFARMSKANLNYIINGRKERQPRLPMLKPGMKVRVQRFPGAKAYDITLDDALLMLLIEHGVEEAIEEEEPVSITHIRSSARKSLCQSFYINRARKGTVFAKDGEEVTCPDCIKLRDEAEARIAGKPTVTVVLDGCKSAKGASAQ